MYTAEHLAWGELVHPQPMVHFRLPGKSTQGTERFVVMQRDLWQPGPISAILVLRLADGVSLPQKEGSLWTEGLHLFNTPGMCETCSIPSQELLHKITLQARQCSCREHVPPWQFMYVPLWSCLTLSENDDPR